ncbi:TPA: four helix bundle protein [Legionella pneumophila subsp. pneumophila]|nr:four helix bundle protein [Legionella pneumophila subsp. pneumophila]
MSLYTDLPVFHDAWQLALRVFEYTKEFGREYKYTLGQEMKRDVLHLVRHLYRANKAEDKRMHLEAFLDDYEFLKLEIRMAAEMKLMSIKKQATLSLLLERIGKQVIGWRKTHQ